MFGFHVNVQEILGPGFISNIPQGNRELPVSPGGQIHRGKCPGVYGFRVGQYGIFNRVLIQVREVVPVIYPDNSLLQIDRLKPHVLIRFFHLGEAGMRFPIGTD